MSNFNFTSIINGNTGTAQAKVGTTVQTFAISLASGFILFSVQFTIFLAIRIYPWSKRIYQPRSYLIPLKNRVPPPPSNPFKWIATVLKVPQEVVLEKDGMDAYFFLRYLSMCLKIFLPLAIVILPILLPINRTDGRGNHTIEGVRYNVTGLDTLAWSNIAPQHTDRYWAHLILALGVIIWTCYLFHRELINYVKKRQEYLSHPSHRLKASATTVLITDIPKDLCTVEKLQEHYDDFPGGLRRIWVNRDYTPLVKMVELRNRLENQLENAETNLLRRCVKQSRKSRSQNNVTNDKGGQARSSHGSHGVSPVSTVVTQEPDTRDSNGQPTSTAVTSSLCQEDLKHDLETGAAWTRYITPGKRPTTGIPKDGKTGLFQIPLLGRLFATKVDTIYYCRRELAKLNIEVDKEREKSEAYPGVRSAFLQFNTQKAAHLACQGLSHARPRRMVRRTIELAPGDINWLSLGLPWWQRYLRMAGFIFLFVVLIFLFGIVSVFTGILSKAGTLSGSASWLNWIADLPSWLVSFIQGTLPPVILIVLLSGPLPIILRLFTNDIRGANTGTDGERSLQLWYLIFLVFELFIIPTISSGLTSVVRELVHNPTSVPNILATNLPTAANYYFSFLIVEALSISAASILQTIRLLNYYVLGSTNTPDSVFGSLTFTNRTRIGSNIPWYTTYAIIGLVYSVIAPLMLVFMLITFSIFYFVIKNNILYVIRTGNVDGGGLFFPSAINQTFAGLYFMEVCLIGLFFLVRNEQGNVACDAQGAIMVVALIFTIFFQWFLYSSFHALYTYLPITSEGEAQQRDKEYELQRLTAKELSADSSEEMDTFPELPPGSPPQHATRPATAEAHSTQNRQASGSILSEKASDNASFSATRPKRAGTVTSVARTVSSHDQARVNHLRNQQQRDGQSADRILARLNRPVNEARLVQLEEHLVSVEQSLGRRLAPSQADVERQMMNDPISKIVMQHNDELEDLTAEERDLLVSVAFTHPVLRQTRPSVWIPQDGLGVSDDEVRRTRASHPDVVIDNRGAFFDRRLKVDVNRPPPDMSEFALIMAEL